MEMKYYFILGFVLILGFLFPLTETDFTSYDIKIGDVISDVNILGNLYVEENLTVNGYADYKTQVIKTYVNENFTAPQADTWYNLSFDEISVNETTTGFSLTNNNESVHCNFHGIVRIASNSHFYNNATTSQQETYRIRLLRNGEEQSSSQSSRSKGFRAGGIDSLFFDGLVDVRPGDNLSVQVQVSDTRLVLASDPAFEDARPLTLNLQKISSLP